MFLPPFRPGGPHATITPLYKHGPDSGTGAVARSMIDVVRDEQIEFAVAIVIHKCAAGVPALAVARHARFFADVGESAVAVVVVENILAKVADEKIIEAVVVVVADADALSPAGVNQSGLHGHVGESAVAIVS